MSGRSFSGFGPRTTPYEGGHLCVASPLRRTAPMNSAGSLGLADGSGSYSFDLNARIQSGSASLLARSTRERFHSAAERAMASAFTAHRP